MIHISRLVHRFVNWWLPVRSRILWVFGVVDPTDLWSLDMTIAEFVLPRLQKFAVHPHKGIPGTLANDFDDESIAADIWSYRLWMMIAAMQLYKDGVWNMGSVDSAKAEIGLDYFAKHFGDLWT